MDKDEALRLIKVEQDAVKAIEKDLELAKQRCRDVVSEVGLCALGLKKGDILLCRGKRWIVDRAEVSSYGYYRDIHLVALNIRKDGSAGKSPMPEWWSESFGCTTWVKEERSE